jgi:hypothetical protein
MILEENIVISGDYCNHLHLKYMEVAIYK